jgi:hypothetical protein
MMTDFGESHQGPTALLEQDISQSVPELTQAEFLNNTGQIDDESDLVDFASTTEEAEAELDAVLAELAENPSELTDDGEEFEPNTRLVTATRAYVLATLKPAKLAYINAEETYSRRKIRVGLRLFRIFFNSTKALVMGKKLHLYKARAKSLRLLLLMEKDLLKPSDLRNMLRCAAQQEWLEEQQVDTSGLDWTLLVYASRMDNGPEKLMLLRLAKEKGWKSRQFLSNMPQRIEDDVPPPPLLDLLSYIYMWIDEFNNYDFIMKILVPSEFGPVSADETLEEVDWIMSLLVPALERLRFYRNDLRANANQQN